MIAMKETVLTVPNHHTRICGKPPSLIAQDCYTGYYENQHGEQMIFQYDHDKKKALLWHGDSGWEEPLPVFAGGCNLVLGEQERQWLSLVWKTATAHESREFHLHSALELVEVLRQAYDQMAKNHNLGPFKGLLTIEIKRLEAEEKILLQELQKIREGLS
ncbi:hypothetical protein ACFLXC_03180 [Chloroflexota bacterium]